MVRFISSERLDSVVVPGLGARASNIALVRGGLGLVTLLWLGVG